MDRELKKWEQWLERSLWLDSGYDKIKVRALPHLSEDVVVRKNGITFEVEILAALRTQPQRFVDVYSQLLAAITTKRAD